NMGSGRIMGFLNDIAPAPGDRPALLQDGSEIPCSDDGEPLIFFYKTLSEPHLGEISYFKVYSGIISSGDELTNRTSGKTERFSQLFLLNGKDREKATALHAGDLGIVLKLKNAKTNDSFGTKSGSALIEKIEYPAPRIRTAITAPNKKDLEKIAVGLHQLQKEDPTLIVDQSKELKQTIIHGQGELHLNIIKYRLEKLYNVEVEFIRPKIPFRETITKSADTSYRHKKQSGGSGQFAEIHMRVEPYYDGMPEPDGLTVRKTETHELSWGGRLEFYWCIVGGSIDAKYTNAIIKGIMQTLENGPLTGSYARDVRVCIYDGKMHSVDSNDMAFQIAASQGFKQAFKQCAPVIMEPLYDIQVLTPDEVMGDIMSDLQSRNAMIMGMDAEGHYQKISARIPLRELYKYSSTLRSLSQGRAKHTRQFSEYSQVSREVQEELVRSHQEDTVEA
ncbi:MAG: elongation factor G, partial [Bacteroidota bacterium]